MAVRDISIPLKYVYVQSTAPTDKTEGKLWYNTSDKALYTSDGTNYVVLDFDTSYIDQQQLEQNINILINSASASSTLNDYDEMFLDIFTSEGGELSTVDTGNTTAAFNAEKYSNDSLNVEDPIGLDTVSGADGNAYGMKITPKSNVILTKVTKESGASATTCTLKNSEGTTIDTQSFSGNDATFNQELTASTEYQIVISGGTTMVSILPAPTYPIEKTNLNYTGHIYHAGGVFSVTTKVKDIINRIVQTKAETITANPTHHQLYCHNTVAGTGSITYDISFDGGTTWDTDQSLNTKNASGHTGSSMIIKLNLNGTGSVNTAEAKDYAVMLYY